MQLDKSIESDYALTPEQIDRILLFLVAHPDWDWRQVVDRALDSLIYSERRVPAPIVHCPGASAVTEPPELW